MNNNMNNGNGNNNNDNFNGGYGGRGGMTYYECGKTGHMARDCWSKRGRSGQQDDEVHVFVRDLMEEKKEEKRKRAEEEQKGREKEKERKRELDIARRTEEMKLQLQADIEDKWRRQQEEMAKKDRERNLQTETVKNGSPKVSLRTRTISKAKSKRPVRRRHAKKRSSKQSTDSSTSSDSEISDSASSDSSEDSEEELLRMVRLLREEKRRVKSKRKQARGRPVRKAPARTCEKGECSKKSTSTLTQRLDAEDEPRTPLTRGDGRQEVVFTSGLTWADRWRNVKTQFGMSEVKIGGRSMLLRQAKKLCEVGGEVSFVKIRKTSTMTERYRHELLSLLKHPRRVTTLPRSPTKKVVGFYRVAGFFRKKETKERLKIKIDRVLKRKTGVSIRRRVTVKYPFDASVLQSKVRRKTEVTIDEKLLDVVVATFVKKKVRLVCTKNRSVASIVHNYRSFAHTLSVVCPCERFQVKKHEGHVLRRLIDIEETPFFVRNSKNVTKTDKQNSREDILQGISTATAYLGKCTRELDVATCFQEIGDRSAAWTERQVRDRALQYEGLVLAPVDRNPGDTALICPILYKHAFGKTFTWNPDYETVAASETEVLATSKRDYEETDLSELGKWKKDGSLGKAYVLPKDKDLQRWRPIAPA
ncbi:hypothetical protein CBR_g17808 [Chara braunii]|uniref:CCHC-type domain-containing protein n=1 Tax=Chara braunii TaxID=69332 RepID=A0A388KVM5_CHABU|nr:hypothetical protein CBR_g17808 [Chara braunii]|eukprot:GBG74097.1 hypothetical protein CBR_g17808 [Chara braunii]